MFEQGSPTDVNCIINEAMANKGITTDDVPTENLINRRKQIRKKSKRYITVKGSGKFRCHRHNKIWKSAHAWCIFDLKTESIFYRYLQDCKICNSGNSPKFSEESMRRMAEYGVQTFLYKMGREIRPRKIPRPTYRTRRPAFRTRRSPHDRKRCGMCKDSKRKCCK